MNATYIIDELEKNNAIFHSLLKNLLPELVHWKPSAEKWNLLEIVCHLYDEEREDFRARIKHVLETPDKPMEKIDPAGWVISRKYAARNFSESLNDFEFERKLSVNWLHSLRMPDWSASYRHESLGLMTAGQFLANWLAHDYLHMRQILKLKYDYLSSLSPVSLDYAGKW